MNNAKYKGQTAKWYPLSTDSLEFIQQQIMLLQEMTCMLGHSEKKYLLRSAGVQQGQNGAIIVDGELLTLKAGIPGAYINIYEQSIDLTEGAESFNDYQVLRFAKRGAQNLQIPEAINKGCFPINELIELPSLLDIYNNYATKDMVLLEHNHSNGNGTAIPYNAIIKPGWQIPQGIFDSQWASGYYTGHMTPRFKDYNDFIILHLTGEIAYGGAQTREIGSVLDMEDTIVNQDSERRVIIGGGRSATLALKNGTYHTQRVQTLVLVTLDEVLGGGERITFNDKIIIPI